jgi:hypothetical protein
MPGRSETDGERQADAAGSAGDNRRERRVRHLAVRSTISGVGTTTRKLPMMSLREQRRLAVRDQLTDAAFALVAERGYERATVERIAARAGVGRTTAFRHFSTKEDLLLGWLDDARYHRLVVLP